MTRNKKAAAAADGPAPDRGGAWIRQADGSLVRDDSEDQHIPDDEEPGEKREPDTAPQPPAVPPASETDQGKEG